MKQAQPIPADNTSHGESTNYTCSKLLGAALLPLEYLCLLGIKTRELLRSEVLYFVYLVDNECAATCTRLQVD